MFHAKRTMSVWTLGTLVIGALVVGALLGDAVRGDWSALAAREAASPASASQAGGQPYKAGRYAFSSKAVADECGQITQINWNALGGTISPVPGSPGGSPAHDVNTSFMPVAGKGGEDVSGPYEPVVGWPQPLHKDYRLGGFGGIYLESDNRIYLSTRGELPLRATPLLKGGFVWGADAIMEYVKAEATPGKRREHYVLVVDGQGKLIESWDQWDQLFARPPANGSTSRINVSRYDPEGYVWIIAGNIYKFTHDGKKLVMTLEDKDPNGKPIGFHGGIAWLPNGDFFALGTNRVVKFSKEGKYLSEFGSHGAGPGQFGGGLQGLVIHPDTRRLYVGDRPNSRMQIFDENGKYLDQWPNIVAVYVLRLTKDGHMWVADSLTHKFLKYDLNGKLLTSWGTFGIAPGTLWGIHYFEVDSEGNLYWVSDYAGGAHKLRPKKDPLYPEQLIGPLVQ